MLTPSLLYSSVMLAACFCEQARWGGAANGVGGAVTVYRVDSAGRNRASASGTSSFHHSYAGRRVQGVWPHLRALDGSKGPRTVPMPAAAPLIPGPGPHKLSNSITQRSLLCPTAHAHRCWKGWMPSWLR
jgi:hypothetical protein